jgi:glycosyltransferase involved in cell wall biosynthesis
MMAKNVESFLAEAIEPLLQESRTEWELILVDDHSSDGTYDIARKIAKTDKRVRVYENPHKGKILGTSFAFERSCGDYIKCIDSDDVISGEFFLTHASHAPYDALFHSTIVVNEELQRICEYHPSSTWIESDYRDVLEGLISIPKFSWSFSREIAEKVFPLPVDLPFEDVWMALMIKRYANRPICVRQTIYRYRQHKMQTFGGILNYSREAVRFRASRLLKLIEVLELEDRAHDGIDNVDFRRARLENRVLIGDAGWLELCSSSKWKTVFPKLLLLRYSPALARFAALAKWRYEARKHAEGA